MFEHPDDRDGGMATEDDAHREWHRNAGVPLGQPGCPQDACDGPEPEGWQYDDLQHGPVDPHMQNRRKRQSEVWCYVCQEFNCVHVRVRAALQVPDDPYEGLEYS